MPYFIYRIFSQSEVEHLETHSKYRDAKNQLREIRAEGGKEVVRTVYATNLMEAERLLTAPREAPVEGDD